MNKFVVLWSGVFLCSFLMGAFLNSSLASDSNNTNCPRCKPFSHYPFLTIIVGAPVPDTTRCVDWDNDEIGHCASVPVKRATYTYEDNDFETNDFKVQTGQGYKVDCNSGTPSSVICADWKPWIP